MNNTYKKQLREIKRKIKAECDKEQIKFIEMCCDTEFCTDILFAAEEMPVFVLEYAKIAVGIVRNIEAENVSNRAKYNIIERTLSNRISEISAYRIVSNIIYDENLTPKQQKILSEINEDYFKALDLDSMDYMENGDYFFAQIENLLRAKSAISCGGDLASVSKQFHINMNHYRTEKTLLNLMAAQTK